MKSFIKNNIKTFLIIVISGVLFSGISVYAVSQYFAKDIVFTPSEENLAKGFNATNVEDAINSLYESSGNNKCKSFITTAPGVGSITLDTPFKPDFATIIWYNSANSKHLYTYIDNVESCRQITHNTTCSYDIVYKDNGVIFTGKYSDWDGKLIAVLCGFGNE